MHKSLEKFKPYIEKGLIRSVVSPCKRLILFNYTDHCTYERAWDEVTLNARGTVYEIETGKVIARAFPKFFNYGELDDEKKQEVLDAEEFEVYEKMDGSLGIVYYYDGEWRVNTRGSFTSDQAVKGKEMLDKCYDMSEIPKDVTLLVEVIYPENRIIVDYGENEELVILGANMTRVNLYLKTCQKISEVSKIRRAPSYKFSSIQELMEHMKTLDHTEEGYVVRLANGYRVKFKSAEYLKLARIMSHMSPLAFWESMENGIVKTDFAEHLPEEFRAECDKLKEQMETSYQNARNAVENDFEYVSKAMGYDYAVDAVEDFRKPLGLLLKEEKLEHSGAMFSRLLGKTDSIEKHVMRYIRPTGNVINDA